MQISQLNKEEHYYKEIYNGTLTLCCGSDFGMMGADLVNGSSQDEKFSISFTQEELARIKEWASKINVV